MSVDITSQDFQDAVSTIVEDKTYNWVADINTSFLLTSGYLVFMMQLGFALVRPHCHLCAARILLCMTCCEATNWSPLAQLTIGAISAKSVKSVCLKNLMDVCAGGVGYFLFGWAFAYGATLSCLAHSLQHADSLSCYQGPLQYTYMSL